MPAINASSFLADLGIDCKDELQKFESLGKKLADEWKRAFDAAPTVLEYLHKRGWSVSNEFTAGHFITINDFATKGAHGDVDQLMTMFVEEIKDNVRKRLIVRFPHRQHIVIDAFQAHDDRKYSLSIPVLLAQADGIGCEIFSISQGFFTLCERATAIDDALDAIDPTKLNVLDDYKGQLLLELKKKHSLHEQTIKLSELQKIDSSYGPLNRHGVLHGLHVNYATHQNSLRCISFLGYILDVQNVPDSGTSYGSKLRKGQARTDTQAVGKGKRKYIIPRHTTRLAVMILSEADHENQSLSSSRSSRRLLC